MPARNKKTVATNHINNSIRFDDSFNVVHEYEKDIGAEHTDRLPVWWMKSVPHYNLEDHEADPDVDIGYFPFPSSVAAATDDTQSKKPI
jgi:hypothetical protein